nr:MAG TPA: hypothetical protein [Bacteriophage sp.]
MRFFPMCTQNVPKMTILRSIKYLFCTHLYSTIIINGLIWHLRSTLKHFQRLQRPHRSMIVASSSLY